MRRARFATYGLIVVVLALWGGWWFASSGIKLLGLGSDALGITGGVTVGGPFKLIDSTGEGVFPKDWNLWPWNPATVAEAVIDRSQGEWAIGIRNAEGPATTMLFAPQFTSPTGYCRLRCEVLWNGKQFGANIRIMPEGQKATNVMAIDRSAEWQTIDLPVDCRTLGRVKFEFHNTANADEVLWIRKYEVLNATKDEYLKK